MKFIKSNLDPVMIEINNESYPAKLTFNAVAELEELTGVGFMTFFNDMATGKYATNDLLKVLFVALKHGGTEITYADLGEMEFSPVYLSKLVKQITHLITRTHKVESSIEDESENTKKK